MINFFEVAETNEMIDKENLDVRTITLGICLLDCIDADLEKDQGEGGEPGADGRGDLPGVWHSHRQ